MSRTLFLYVFKDLLRIFLLTSGALAGIMSFGGLLRPVTQHGLDASQVGKVLTFFMPAMLTYSLPIAALFATTVVYGRLAADNEITACRAAGISYVAISAPAWVLGLLVAITSLVFLCFIVPGFTLKVERVIYSNLAKLVANQIERTRQIRYQDLTIFAERAEAAPPNPAHPEEQLVTLEGLMIVSYERPDPSDPRLQIAKDFYLARAATVVIRRGGGAEEEYTLEVLLDSGAAFPRDPRRGGIEGGIAASHFGPVTLDSPIGEDTKFMDLRRLHELYADPMRSRDVRKALRNIIRRDQEAGFLEEVLRRLTDEGRVQFTTGGDESYELTQSSRQPKLQRGVLTANETTWRELRGDKTTLTAEAAQADMTARVAGEEQMNISVELIEPMVRTADGESPRQRLPRAFRVPMPDAIRALAMRPVGDYLARPELADPRQHALFEEINYIVNGVQGEMHGRASFAVSCLILVIVGGALGMMFRSGNYLTAFALSVAPALICIALIAAGQKTCESAGPANVEQARQALRLGLGLIWSGNAAVAALALVLMWRLQRQ